MMIILSLLAAFYALGTVILAHGIHNAPEAYEDETGFNLVWQNNHPEAANVACVWETSFATA